LTRGAADDSVAVMGSTKKELIEDLWKKPHSLKRQAILKRAGAGHYHDFETEIAAPKIQLVTDLRDAGFMDLAEKTIDGAYDDESPTIEQQEELRREFGPDAYDRLMGAKERGQS
jgi:hypothetical protein